MVGISKLPLPQLEVECELEMHSLICKLSCGLKIIVSDKAMSPVIGHTTENICGRKVRIIHKARDVRVPTLKLPKL